MNKQHKSISVMTDEELEALRERNAKRLQEAKEKMGRKYLLHRDNFVTRKASNQNESIR